MGLHFHNFHKDVGKAATRANGCHTAGARRINGAEHEASPDEPATGTSPVLEGSIEEGDEPQSPEFAVLSEEVLTSIV